MIPAGITYAQLSILLNEIAGWKERSGYEYEFYHRGLRLREDDGIRPFRPNWRYDLLKANETYIDECFDQEEWFSYHLDSGYSHRIEIEKISEIEDDNPCPFVEKYKGECPGEESGSYNLERINTILKERYNVLYGEKADFSKQEELYDRIGRKEYGLSGQVDPVNDKGGLYKSANRVLQEFSDQLNIAFKERARVYTEQNPDEDLNEDEDIADGLMRFLMGCVSAKEDTLQSKVYSEMLHKKEPERTERLTNTLLKNAIDYYSKETLLDYADELNLSDYASLDEKRLREKIAGELLRPSVMRRKISSLTDKQIELFEKILNERQMYRFTEEEESGIVKLHNLDYIIRYKDGLVEVPIDVKTVYEFINTPEFQKERGQTAWLGSCLWIASLLYAEFPISVLRRLYRRKPGYKAERQELKEMFHKIPEEERFFYLKDDLFISKTMRERDEFRLFDQQMMGEDYYIPSLEEIESYAEHEYFFHDPAYQELRKFLKQQDGLDFDDIEEILYAVNFRLSRRWPYKEVSETIQREFFTFSDKKEFTSLVEKAAEHSRLRIFRGFTRSEMIERNTADLDHVLAEGERLLSASVRGAGEAPRPASVRGAGEAPRPVSMRGAGEDPRPEPARQTDWNLKNKPDTKKIYPNDPCPCGSGKKYKKCCGRKR